MHQMIVQSDIHSTDAFGYSEAIFATSHLLGFAYAPRFKNLKRQRLYIFNSRRQAWELRNWQKSFQARRLSKIL